MGSLSIVPLATVLVAALIAAITDLWNFKVHNVLTLPLLVAGLIYHGLVGGPTELGGSALGAVFGFGILIFFHVLGGMGGGDVKLMSAIGAWLGMPLTFNVFLASSLIAGVYALILMLWFGNPRETWINVQIIWHRIVAIGHHLGAEDHVETEVKSSGRRRRAIPFAAMLALGIILIVAWSQLLTKP